MYRILQTFLLLLIFTTFSQFGFAQSGYEIKIKIEEFDQKECYLGYFYGDKQYLRDTAEIDENGWFSFKGEEALPGGVYMVVLPPKNQFIQLLVSEEEQHFSITTNANSLGQNAKVEGSMDNELFYSYLDFLGGQRPKAEKIRAEIEAEKDEEKKEVIEKKIEAIDTEVFDYQDKIIKENPKTLTAAIIRANKPLVPPTFEGTEEEIQMSNWLWTKEHYFDFIDLQDPRMVRTPFLFQRVDHYINKLTAQHPDSISKSLDFMFAKMEGNEDIYKYYLVHFLNEYAKSKVVGFDAVYVHLALNYYKEGKAPWTDEDQLKKIIDNGESLNPLLIGKTAPNITMETKDGDPLQLHDFEADYTVLFFWDPDCGHCKKATPLMLEFHEKFKDKGVKVFGVCTKLVTKDDEGLWSTEEIDDCWKYIEEKGTDIWLNTVDPFHRSRYKSVYDLKTTPQIYVLDKEKKIVMKKIGAEQISEVMEEVLKNKEKS